MISARLTGGLDHPPPRWTLPRKVWDRYAWAQWWDAEWWRQAWWDIEGPTWRALLYLGVVELEDGGYYRCSRWFPMLRGWRGE